ncbi:MAG TPA: glycosyltransferase family 39 protein [Bryobacteraceae bacterium]
MGQVGNLRPIVNRPVAWNDSQNGPIINRPQDTILPHTNLMLAVPQILFGAALFVLTALALGALLFRILAVRLYRLEEPLLAFVAGSGLLSAILFVLCTVNMARASCFLAIGVIAIAAALWFRGRRDRDNLPSLPKAWSITFSILIAAFSVWYFVNALAPEMSPDGMAYHLWLPAEYARAHGFVRIPTSIFANFPQGMELLFLFAFVFGKHSSAALVHFSFLAALPWLILCYGRRFGFSRAAAAAAVLTFASPIVGVDGASAYVDVGLATIGFALFYVLRIWDTERQPGLLILAGVFAGFAFAVKYTGVMALVYALVFVAWKLVRKPKEMFRSTLAVGAVALVLIAPWMLKNWIWVGNPVSPFANRWFPNPYVHVSFEEDYRTLMRNQQVRSWNEIPMQLAVKGAAVGGIVGPFFLLVPIALLAARKREGRRILLAGAVFLLPYFSSIGARFMIPALPFASLAIALALANASTLLFILMLAAGLVCWPPVVNMYCVAPAWGRPSRMPLRQALRLEPEESWLSRRSPAYAIAKLVEQKVPEFESVFAFGTPARSYLKRKVTVRFESAQGEVLGDILWSPLFANQPALALDFHFPQAKLQKVRLVQTATAADAMWSVSELRMYSSGEELARSPEWRLTAQPNPWDVQLAFDNTTVTRWRSWEPARPGMFLEIDFGAARPVDMLRVERADGENEMKYRVDGMDASGRWTTLASESAQRSLPTTVNLRREATREMLRHGFHYLLVDQSDPGASDYQRFAASWGLTLVGESQGSRLYHID